MCRAEAKHGLGQVGLLGPIAGLNMHTSICEVEFKIPESWGRGAYNYGKDYSQT
jgi:hypothetical protein